MLFVDQTQELHETLLSHTVTHILALYTHPESIPQSLSLSLSLSLLSLSVLVSLCMIGSFELRDMASEGWRVSLSPPLKYMIDQVKGRLAACLP